MIAALSERFADPGLSFADRVVFGADKEGWEYFAFAGAADEPRLYARRSLTTGGKRRGKKNVPREPAEFEFRCAVFTLQSLDNLLRLAKGEAGRPVYEGDNLSYPVSGKIFSKYAMIVSFLMLP